MKLANHEIIAAIEANTELLNEMVFHEVPTSELHSVISRIRELVDLLEPEEGEVVRMQ
jgi:hypothetical protein